MAAKSQKKFIQGAIKHPGAFTREAKQRGLTPAQLQSAVLAHPENYPANYLRQANLRKTLVGKKVGGKK